MWHKYTLKYYITIRFTIINISNNNNNTNNILTFISPFLASLKGA